MNTMSFYEFRSEQQAQAIEFTFSRKTRSCHSQNCFNNVLASYLHEKLSSYHHTVERYAQMYIRSENLFYQTNVFIDFKI